MSCHAGLMDEQISCRVKVIESGYKSGENRADGLVIGTKFDAMSVMKRRLLCERDM